MIDINEILESLEYETFEEGLTYSGEKFTNFSQTDGSEKYLQDMLKEVSKSTGIPLKELNKSVKEEIKKRTEIMKKTPKLTVTTIKNLGESVVWDIVTKHEDFTKDVKFDNKTFLKLFNEIKTDNPEFYPMSNAFETRRVEPRIYIVPDPKRPEFDGVTTAACTPKGQLLFNKKFMEQLLKFGKVKGIKVDPKSSLSKKYVSNGGDIPDEYAYIEFLILHEIMHYVNGDFYFEKAFKLNGTIVNYVGDFISNYTLVKSGLPQLPIGLFNEEINYDNYISYNDMYKVVKDELDKLPPEDQDELSDVMQPADDMPAEGEGVDPNEDQKQTQQKQQKSGGSESDNSDNKDGGQEGENNEPQTPSDEGEPGGDGKGDNGSDDTDDKSDEGKQGKGSGEESDDDSEEKDGEGKGSGKDGEENDNGSETGQSDDEIEGKIPENIDEIIKRNVQEQEQVANVQRDKERPSASDMAKMASQSGSNTGTGKLSADGNPFGLPEKQYKPQMNWKQLLKKMIPSGVVKSDTYTKPSRRSVSSMVTLSQTGSGVVKPGEKESDSEKRGLLFIIDESGSTMGAIGKFKADILKLLEKHKKQLGDNMYILQFSNNVHLYKLDLKKKKSGLVKKISDVIEGKEPKVKLDQPLTRPLKSTYGGGTELHQTTVDIALKLHKKHNYNVVLFTDTDCAGGTNLTNLKKIYKGVKPNSFALVLTSLSDYETFAKIFGEKKNITYLK